MVGFGSSLRMSRRRGWEDAYLDYASLRLLLTQIEAVYEEEDWKRGGCNSGNALNSSVHDDDDDDDDSIGDDEYANGDYVDRETLDEENDDSYRERCCRVSSLYNATRPPDSALLMPPNARFLDHGAMSSSVVDGAWSGALEKAFRNTHRAIFGRQHRRKPHHNCIRGCRRRRRRRRRNRSWNRFITSRRASNTNSRRISCSSNSNKRVLDGKRNVKSDVNPNSSGNSNGNKGGNGKDVSYRALDKGGWRSPGVTDYRDELFLESDDDVAFGIYDDFDDDEDEDEDEDNDHDVDYYYGYGATYFDDFGNAVENQNHEEFDNYKQDEESPIAHNEEHQSKYDALGRRKGIMNNEVVDKTRLGDSFLTMGNFRYPEVGEGNSNVDTSGHSFDNNETRNMMLSPTRETLNDSFGTESKLYGMPNGVLETPTPYTPITYDYDPQQSFNSKKQFYTHSPGILEESYETFADAAAKNGGSHRNSAGGLFSFGSFFRHSSPPAEESWAWLEFFPNLLFGWNRPKHQSQETKPLHQFLESDEAFLHRASDPLPHDVHQRQIRNSSDYSSFSPHEASFRSGSDDTDSPRGYTHLSETFMETSRPSAAAEAAACFAASTLKSDTVMSPPPPPPPTLMESEASSPRRGLLSFYEKNTIPSISGPDQSFLSMMDAPEPSETKSMIANEFTSIQNNSSTGVQDQILNNANIPKIEANPHELEKMESLTVSTPLAMRTPNTTLLAATQKTASTVHRNISAQITPVTTRTNRNRQTPNTYGALFPTTSLGTSIPATPRTSLLTMTPHSPSVERRVETMMSPIQYSARADHFDGGVDRFIHGASTSGSLDDDRGDMHQTGGSSNVKSNNRIGGASGLGVSVVMDPTSVLMGGNYGSATPTNTAVHSTFSSPDGFFPAYRGSVGNRHRNISHDNVQLGEINGRRKGSLTETMGLLAPLNACSKNMPQKQSPLRVKIGSRNKMNNAKPQFYSLPDSGNDDYDLYRVEGMQSSLKDNDGAKEEVEIDRYGTGPSFNGMYSIQTPVKPQMIEGYASMQTPLSSNNRQTLHHQYHYRNNDQFMRPLSSAIQRPQAQSASEAGGFILDFLFGQRDVGWLRRGLFGNQFLNSKTFENSEMKNDKSRKRPSVQHQGDITDDNLLVSGAGASSSNGRIGLESSSSDHQGKDSTSSAGVGRRKQSASVASRRRARLKRQLQRRRRREARVPEHLRTAHARASAITERFLGLLRAEVEKVILFANSRLGELSDTLGSLRFPSYDDGQEDVRKKYPNLADGGMHQSSSSDEEEGYDLTSSSSSTSTDGQSRNRIDEEQDDNRRVTGRSRAHRSESSKEKGVVTRRQMMLRDRLRISKPMFQKADFLGEDFSLLSALDEVDAYTAVGVELMHLLKFVCVNVIAVRKICKKHDRLLANRMLGGYYHRQMKEQHRRRHSHNHRQVARPGIRRKSHGSFRWNKSKPQFGGALSNAVSSPSSRGFIHGIYDVKIQHIANSTIMQTVSSSLTIALADFEASQSRSSRLGRLERIEEKHRDQGSERRDFSDSISTGGTHFLPQRHEAFTPSRIQEVVNYPIGGQCFQADDDSSTHTHDGGGDENMSTSSNISLTRLQFVVTSVFGLREAARIKKVPFEHFASRLLMTSVGPNVTGDGLDGCSRETLDFLCIYNPDAAYTLDGDSLYSCLKIGRDKDGVGEVMVACLAAAAKANGNTSNDNRFQRHVSAVMSIKPQATGEDSSFYIRNVDYRNVLRLNTASMLLYSFNYYIATPSSHIYAKALGSKTSLAAALIGAANLSSFFSSLVHSFLISKRDSFIKKHVDPSFFRIPLIASALISLFGNILYSYSLSYRSVSMALLGRLLVGFGSAEVLNRHLLTLCVPQESLNIEVAILMKRCMMTTAISLFFGALFDIRVQNKSDFVSILQRKYAEAQSSISAEQVSLFISPTLAPSIDTVSSQIPRLSPSPSIPSTPIIRTLFGEHHLIHMNLIGYIMSFLWLLQIFGLLFFFDIPKNDDQEGPYNNQVSIDRKEWKQLEANDDGIDSDSAVSVRGKQTGFLNDTPYDPSNLSSDSKGGRVPLETNPFMLRHANSQEINRHGEGTFEKLQTMSRDTVKHRPQSTHIDGINNVRKLIFSNIAFPTTLALLFLAKATNEIFLSSCATIAHRYFSWTGACSGLFMGLMTMLILPINFFLSLESNVKERRIMKLTLDTAKYGLIVMVNYKALFLLIRTALKGNKKWQPSTDYNGFAGVIQYILSFVIVFISIVVLESASLSLMSKVSPVRLQRYSIDGVFWVVVVSTSAKLMGDILIYTVDLSSWLFCSDIINSLCFFLVFAFMTGGYVVRKHYFFLL